MTAYGNFEAIQPVFKTHHGSIWSARAAGTDESADCCIKLLELDDDMLEQRDTSLAQNLLVSAALQQAMGNKSEFWAPVYGLGSQGTNAFYASRMFPRSVQTLIDNNTALTAAELKIILLSIIDGLIDLESAFHRSHSNLKPTNVLLDDPTRIRSGGVFLSDPDPSTENVPSLTRTPDTKAIGELLYALVTHKPHSTARWPLPKSDKWKELGSTGRQWRSVCENLLNTVSRRGLPTLGHLRDQIDAIEPTRRRASSLAIFALVALAALGSTAYVKKNQLPGWYRLARDKVAVLVSNSPPQFMSAGVPVSTTMPSQPDVQNPATPSVQVIEPTVASDPIKPVPAEPLAVVPTPPPTVGARPPAPVPARTDFEAARLIQNVDPPEFHSDSARAEFIQDRDQFALSHSSTASDSLLSDWEKILSKSKALDADYPPLDAAAAAGWPKGLASLLNARRDEMLGSAIDSAFGRGDADSAAYRATTKRVQTAADAVVVAHDAMARGDIPASKKAIDQCNAAVDAFPPHDSDLAELFAPAKKEFDSLGDVLNSTDRETLLQIADTDGASLAVRLAAWLRADTISTERWPADFPTLLADQARADRFNTLLAEVGSVDIARQATSTEEDRQKGFFAKLKDQPAVMVALKQAIDPKYAALVAKSPVWFRYDVALYVLRNTPPLQVTAEQKKTYTNLSGQVNAPGVQLVHDALLAAQAKPPPLAQCGPGSVKGWQLRSGWTRDHCTFISISSGDTLEFLRVHVTGDADGIDCYLCTTETPVAVMQNLLKGDAVALSAAETLNASNPPAKEGMRLWSFDDNAVAVDLDEDDYRKCFVVSPSEQLPVQFVTPQTAFYLARRAGCRLPTSREWAAALAQSKNSSELNMKGFATMGWKLRDREFARLLTNPNRDADYWPDDNIFTGNLDGTRISRRGNAAIWTTSALNALGGSAASENPATPAAWPLSTLQTSSGFGFRTVGDLENYAGVFHDLIGNVAEYVMDEPVVLAEKVAVAPPLTSDEIVHGVNDWFSPERQAAVSVIGGSALSPPELDPTKPYPLPKDQNQFADVGFRMAFTDPASLANAQKALIGQAEYLTAP